MQLFKKILKWIFIIVISLLLIVNLFILTTGRTYLYKGISNTYLKGRIGPSISEYQIFDNRIVKTGKHMPWNISKNYNTYNFSANEKNYLDSFKTVAFVVIQNDSILQENYYDGITNNSHTNSFSMAKSILGILVGVALQDGKIKSIDDPVAKYLPEFKQMEKTPNEITIRHLLTMSSGINFDEDYVNPIAYPAEAYYGSDLRELTFRTKYKATETPGKYFKYRSGDSQLLAFVIHAATGMRVSDYASEKLWKKIGAKNNAIWNLDQANGNEKSFCCFNSNATDFARFGKLILNNGKFNNIQIVDSAYINQMTQDANLIDSDTKKPKKIYGFQWWILPEWKNHKVIYMRGILGQYVFVVPDLKLIIVRLGHIRDKGDETKLAPRDVYNYLEMANNIIINKR